MSGANGKETVGFGLRAILLGIALVCGLLLWACSKPSGNGDNEFDPKVKPTSIPNQAFSYALKFTGGQGVTILGFYQTYQPDGTESMELLEGQSAPLTITLTAACLRGVLVRGGSTNELELEILRDGVSLQHYSCSDTGGGIVFRYPEDQG